MIILQLRYVIMVNSKHSVKLKSALKIGLRSSSINMNDIQATPTTSGTNEDEKIFKETVKKFCLEKSMKENNSSTSLETFFSKRNLIFTRVTSKN